MTTHQARRSSERDVSGEDAAIYCRISKAEDDDQTGVDRQERICRRIAERLGLRVKPEHVYIDNSRSAWQRKRKRPGWDRMLEAAANKAFRHVIAYHPDRLMRQPRDLEELLNVSDQHGITLHGEANRHDLSNPDHRFMLRIEVAHACRSSDDTSRRLLSAMEERAERGVPHTGKRRFGYKSGGVEILEEEAKWIRATFRMYLDGKTPVQIAHHLNENGSTTATGLPWNDVSVRNLLGAPHVAAIRVFRGEEQGQGNWPAIIDAGEWREVQERRSYRSAALADTNSRKRFYLLRGLVYCTACQTHMSGSSGEYRCSRRHQPDGRATCKRVIKAAQLDEFVRDAALILLERLRPDHSDSASSLPGSAALKIEEDKAQLAELNQMWARKEITTPEYRQMRREIQKRIDDQQRRTVVRPAKVLEGVTGPNARTAWFAEEMTDERRNAILRFLFAAVRVGPATKHGTFDFGRVDIEPNEL